MSGYPDNNPKTAIGVTKVPLHLVPPSAKHYLALALADGARKYGPYNWREHEISVSVYKAAAERHLDAFWDGENVAPDSRIHHVAHAMACCALILDAFTLGKLKDDRPLTGATPRLQAEYQSARPFPMASDLPDSPLVAAMIELHDEDGPTSGLKAGEALNPVAQNTGD